MLNAKKDKFRKSLCINDIKMQAIIVTIKFDLNAVLLVFGLTSTITQPTGTTIIEKYDSTLGGFITLCITLSNGTQEKYEALADSIFDGGYNYARIPATVPIEYRVSGGLNENTSNTSTYNSYELFQQSPLANKMRCCTVKYYPQASKNALGPIAAHSKMLEFTTI